MCTGGLAIGFLAPRLRGISLGASLKAIVEISLLNEELPQKLHAPRACNQNILNIFRQIQAANYRNSQATSTARPHRKSLLPMLNCPKTCMPYRVMISPPSQNMKRGK